MIRDEDVIRVASARGQYAPDESDPRRFFFLFDHAAYAGDRRNSSRPERSIRCAVSIPLPSSPALKPWLYLEPDDAADFLGQLDAFIEEEVLQGCLVSARQEQLNGVRIFQLARYGLERASR